MLLDTLTLALIIQAKNHIAARQLLGDLVRRTPAQLSGCGIEITDAPDPVFYYQRQVVTRACLIAGPGAAEWLQQAY